MSNIKDKLDPEVMAEEAGYKRGCLETQVEISCRIKAILTEYLHTDKQTAFQMASEIGKILDAK